MAATTTEWHPVMLPGEGLRICGSTTAFFNSTAIVAFPSSLATEWGPFRRGTTAADCIRVPIASVESALFGLVIFDGTGSSDGYPVVAVRKPLSTSPGAWMQAVHCTGAIGMCLGNPYTSAIDSGWKMLTSTAAFSGTSTRGVMYSFGPLESARYAHYWGPVTSSNGVDANQAFFEFMIGMTTGKVQGGTSTNAGLIGAGIHWSTFSTTQIGTNIGSSAGSYLFCAFELPVGGALRST